MKDMKIIHSHGHELCMSCGAMNRWWVSRKGYNQEYINWIDTGLCPKCYECAESNGRRDNG